MSPEQLSGEEVDERTDIFSIGVMIVESLTGRHPFRGRTPTEVVQAILKRPFRLDGTSRFIQQLDEVLRKCLARERHRRYASLAEVQDEVIPLIRCCPPLVNAESIETVELVGSRYGGAGERMT